MKVIDFLKNTKAYNVATVDVDQPHSRPIGFVMEYKGQLAFYFDSRKKCSNSFKQIQNWKYVH